MAMTTELKTFVKLCGVVGPEAAAKLCGFFGGMGRSLAIPSKPICGHIVEKVVGREAFVLLTQTHGGTSIWVPRLDLSPLRRAGLVYALGRQGVSPSLQAAVADCSPQRINQLRRELALEGIDTDVLSFGSENGD